MKGTPYALYCNFYHFSQKKAPHLRGLFILPIYFFKASKISPDPFSEIVEKEVKKAGEI